MTRRPHGKSSHFAGLRLGQHVPSGYASTYVANAALPEKAGITSFAQCLLVGQGTPCKRTYHVVAATRLRQAINLLPYARG